MDPGTGLTTLEISYNGSNLAVVTISGPPDSGRVTGISGLSSFPPVQATFEWDEHDNLLVAKDPLAVEKPWPGIRYEYADPSSGLLTAAVSSEAERIEYVYDSERRLREVRPIGEEDPVHLLTYAAKEPVSDLYATAYTSPLSERTVYRYDHERRLHEVEDVDSGDAVALEWQGKRPTKVTQPGGLVTQRTYLNDDVATISEPSGNVTTVTYELTGVLRDRPDERAIKRVEDSLGLVEERAYDAQGRLIGITNGAGETISFTHFEGKDLVQTRTEADGASLTFAYLSSSRPRSVTDPQGNEFTNDYHFSGKLIRSMTGTGPGVWERGYDVNGNLVTLWTEGFQGIQNPQETNRNAVEIDRRSDGRPMRVRRIPINTAVNPPYPDPGDDEFQYDALGRLVQRREEVNGTWVTTTLEYDQLGRVTAKQLPNGMRQVEEYDPQGRVERRRNLRNGLQESEVVYTYLDGQLSSVADSIRGTEFYTPDEAGRVRTILYPSGEVLTLDYDLRSRLVRETYSLPGQGTLRTIEYEYDLANRRIRTTDQGIPIVQRVFSAGRHRTTTYGNGLARSYDYDPIRGLFVGSTTLDGTGSVVETTTVTRELASETYGQLTAITATSGPGPTMETAEQYWFAPFCACPPILAPEYSWPWESKRVTHWFNDANEGHEYAYDPLSNRWSTASDTFNYNQELNRLQSAQLGGSGQTISYTYDEAGYVTARNGAAIAWTAHGLVASVGADTFQWDALGRPMATTVGGVERAFGLFGGRIQTDPQTGLPLLLDMGTVSINLVTNQRIYRHEDFRGNVKFISNDSGAIVSHYRYDPYGPDAVIGSTSDPVRFAGAAEAGSLVLMGSRIYDPAVGRFLSPDPVFQLLNQYSYTFGDPVNFWDPDGAEPQTKQEAFDELRDMQRALVVVGALIVSDRAALGRAIARRGTV